MLTALLVKPRSRLDEWLFQQKFFDSRERARREILAGRIYEKASGRILDKPGMRVPSKGLEVRIAEAARFVSRAGEKLSGFLADAQVSLRDQRVLDVGSSTGGFTDCALQSGARSALCVDVGTNQLHEKIRQDPRVQVFEQTDIRNFPIDLYFDRIDFVLIDVSFISVRLFLEKLVLSLPGRRFIILFKPQFEAGREARRVHGVLDESDRLKTLESFRGYLKTLSVDSILEKNSQVKGLEGNQETFFSFESPALD